MKKLISTFLLSLVSVCVLAKEENSHKLLNSPIKDNNFVPKTTQNTPEKPATLKKDQPAHLPNNGSLVIDWGPIFLINNPEEIDFTYWRSYTTNVCMYYNIHLGRYPFVISPGIGLAFNRYQIHDNNITIRNEDDKPLPRKTKTILPKADEMLQSVLKTRYLDFILEARWNVNEKYPKESFFIALGGKLGCCWEAHTVIKYKEDSEVKRRKDIESFNINKMRGGFYGKLGWKRFGLCYTHMLSNFFHVNKGLGNEGMRMHSITLSIDLF